MWMEGESPKKKGGDGGRLFNVELLHNLEPPIDNTVGCVPSVPSMASVFLIGGGDGVGATAVMGAAVVETTMLATEASNFKYEEEYIVNSKGLLLFTCRWLPVDTEPRALVFLNHGYGMECSVSMKGAALRLVKAGFAVYGIDNQGHGKSSGMQAYIPSFDDLATDCSDFFTKNKRKLRILLGKSMGGAMALLLHLKKPEYWDGAVLVAPLCKIADDIKPPQLVISMLRKLTKIIPTWKIIPGQNFVNIVFRDSKIREEVRNNPLFYKGRVSLQTANQLLNVSLDIEKRLQEVTLPFFVGHGEADNVTDPTVSKLLYETASSSEKTIKLYPEMWHSLTYGEFTENIDIVFGDIISWIDGIIATGNSRLEREQKNANDELHAKSRTKRTRLID
ncbi:caffeoylshikimate esterase-like [Bidens hawaiensis]|uniref:caffeoylshikimate esterase-like n=1 Tax=Bidens hawaiensis TaxID=980011 RepID=UPI00404A817D